MTCGTAAIVIVVGVFVVALFNYPKHTLGCSGVLLVVGAIFIGTAVERNEKSNAEWRANYQKEQDEQRRREEKQEAERKEEEVQRTYVAMAIKYSPKTCGRSRPIAVTVSNGANRTLNVVKFAWGAYYPGRSSNLVQYQSGPGETFDLILVPKSTGTLCYALPSGLRDAEAASELRWSPEQTVPLFASQDAKANYPPPN